MQVYATLVEAINALRAKGYNRDFNLRQDCIECSQSGAQLSAADFEITETYHFDGSTDVDDEVVLYAIESKTGLKGILVNAFGIYSDSASDELIAKIRFRK
ncbi:MAG: phosphoribosylpyrophosphate synthetase [Chitinophagales bacterium]|nr:phosphoribosylpyrophosphate synthetase [Chitinophagales bacterium]